MTPIVFVCGTPHGGAVDSTASLARCAIVAGHPVQFVVAASDVYSTMPRLNRGLATLSRFARPIGVIAWRIYERRHGRGTDVTLSAEHGAVPAVSCSDVVGAARRVAPPGALLVVNSLRRLDLKRLVDHARANGSRIVWYLREESSLASVPAIGPQVDVLLANSRPLADAAAVEAGRTCGYVPSVITVDDLAEPFERRVLLAVNTVPSYGVDEALRIAAALPDHAVVLQESWPLSDDDATALAVRVAELPNVEFRRRGPRSGVYRDASIMLLPHSAAAVGANRPRVALEAQYLGLPTIAFDIPGLAAVTASPELRVPLGSSIDEWVRAIHVVEADYERFATAARTFAVAELATPAEVWSRFVNEVGLSST